MKFKEIYDRLPASWDTFRFEDYMKCIDIPIEEDKGAVADLETLVKIVAAITSEGEEELSTTLTMVEANVLAKKLAFMAVEPVANDNTSIQWKKIDKVSYDTFISFLSLQEDAVHNLGKIVQLFSEKPITDMELNNMSVQEVHCGFFTLKKYAYRYLNSLIGREMRKLSYLKAKTLISQKFRSRIKN